MSSTVKRLHEGIKNNLKVSVSCYSTMHQIPFNGSHYRNYSMTVNCYQTHQEFFSSIRNSSFALKIYWIVGVMPVCLLPQQMHMVMTCTSKKRPTDRIISSTFGRKPTSCVRNILLIRAGLYAHIKITFEFPQWVSARIAAKHSRFCAQFSISKQLQFLGCFSMCIPFWRDSMFWYSPKRC